MPSHALTLAFIEARPAAAARALAALPPEQAGAFLEAVPTRYAERVAAHVSAWSAAAMLSRMTTVAAAAILRELDHTNGAAILRLMPAHVRAPLLEDLPGGLKRAFETSLSFTPDAVGAHMSLAVVVLDENDTVAHAREQVRHATGADAEIVFVADQERRFVGVVTALMILRAGDDARLGAIMRRDAPGLSARSRLLAAADLEAWNTYAALPVLNRERQVIGALSRRAAHAAPEWPAPAAAQTPSIATQLVGAFSTAALELAALLTERSSAQERRPE